jgi:hypothetical protein
MIANLHLPEGATIQNVRCWVIDDVPGSAANQAISMAWSVQGTTCNGVAASCGCSNNVTSVDAASGTVQSLDLTLYAGPNPDLGCIAPVSSTLDHVY